MFEWRLHREDVLDSTSDLCRMRAQAGEPEGLAVLAGRQTAGRGSRGRSWESPPGNLYLSVLLRPREPARMAGQWALLAGLALLEGLETGRREAAAPPAPRLSLKWPNDVLLGGDKLAGVLLDSAADTDGVMDWLVIGMGANLAAAPTIPGRKTAALGRRDAEATALGVLARLAHWREARLRGSFAVVRDAWLARAAPVGSPLALRLADGVRHGAFAGLGQDGNLLMQAGGKVQSFAAGEVMLAAEPAT